MKFRGLFVVLLVLLLLLAVGCNHNDAPPASDPTSFTTAASTTGTTATEAPNESLMQYRTAAQALSQKQDVALKVTVQETLSLPVEQIKQKTVTDIIYLGLGTEQFEARVVEAVSVGTSAMQFTEIYSGGHVYLKNIGGSFAADESAEGFIARQMPVVLIDERKYENCNSELTAEGTVVTFSNCLTPEDWYAREGVNLVSAQATALIGPDGALERYTYDLRYSLMGAWIDQQITVEISAPKVDGIEEPTSMEGYVESGDVELIKSILVTYLRTRECTSVSYQYVEDIYSQASGDSLLLTLEAHTYGQGNQYMSKVAQTIPATGQGDEAWSLEETFLKGTFTTKENNEPEQEDPQITQSMMKGYVYGFVTELMFGPAHLTDLTVTDLGDVLLIECSGDEFFCEGIEDSLCNELYGDPDLIDQYASAYRTEKMEVFIAIDKHFSFLTAVGYNYEGVHTIDGQEYTLYAIINAGYTAASQDSHNAISEEAMPMATEDSPTPLFYHVTGANGEEMWLLGTIHVGDGRTANLPKEITNAFRDADALAVECDVRKFEEELENPLVSNAYAMAIYYVNGTQAKDHITDPELYDYAVKMMKASGNYTSYADSLKVSVWGNSISNFVQRLCYGPAGDMGVDNRLLRMADESGKKILQIESNLSQAVMLSGWSDPLAEVLLADALSSDAVTYYNELMGLYELWCAGDEAELKKALETDTAGLSDEEKALWEEYNNAMSVKRNKKMAETAVQYLESGETVFYAVGLAHVIAEDGLVNALRDAGYTVTLVTYE